jgi:lyso-ornithine lipid O-acyltransferase
MLLAMPEMPIAPFTATRPLLPRFVEGSLRQDVWPDTISASRRRLRQARAIRRGAMAVLWTLLACLVQAVMLALPGRGKVVFARLYWAGICRCIGLSVHRMGGVPQRSQVPGRRVVFVANHASWLDIPVLGGRLEACFVSKDEIARWPGVSVVARLGRTVFVSRTRGATGRERDDMRTRLTEGDNLLLFAEGTSSDGSRVLPFRSAFFSVAAGEDPPLIQPVSVVYDRLAGMPTGRNRRPVFSWYGDMNLATHFWQFAQWTGLRATVLLHPPLDPRDFADRKALALAAWDAVANGAAALRQNKPERALARTPA